MDYKKVNNLTEAIKENNLLHLYPIVVDEADNILDGQHRFEACKQAEELLSFVVADSSYTIDKVAETNDKQSHWKLQDYVLFYAAGGKSEYKKLLRLSNKYMITPGIIISLEGKYSSNADVKEGVFMFTNHDLTVEVLEPARQINEKYGFDHWKRRQFLHAVKWLLRSGKFKTERFFESMDKDSKQLLRCHEAEEYIRLVEGICNKGVKKANHVKFL